MITFTWTSFEWSTPSCVQSQDELGIHGRVNHPSSRLHHFERQKTLPHLYRLLSRHQNCQRRILPQVHDGSAVTNIKWPLYNTACCKACFLFTANFACFQSGEVQILTYAETALYNTVTLKTLFSIKQMLWAGLPTGSLTCYTSNSCIAIYNPIYKS